MLVHDVNQGMSEAYYLAFGEPAVAPPGRRRAVARTTSCVHRRRGTDSTSLRCSRTRTAACTTNALSTLLVQRDPADVSALQAGRHWAMSTWATIWSGGVAPGMTSSPATGSSASALADAPDYYQGQRNLETVEVAIVPVEARLPGP